MIFLKQQKKQKEFLLPYARVRDSLVMILVCGNLLPRGMGAST